MMLQPVDWKSVTSLPPTSEGSLFSGAVRWMKHTRPDRILWAAWDLRDGWRYSAHCPAAGGVPLSYPAGCTEVSAARDVYTTLSRVVTSEAARHYGDAVFGEGRGPRVGGGDLWTLYFRAAEWMYTKARSDRAIWSYWLGGLSARRARALSVALAMR